jgi:hypothetical protein
VYLYWIVSDVVEARSLVMRILTMLKRKMKLICEDKERSKNHAVSPELCHRDPMTRSDMIRFLQTNLSRDRRCYKTN